MNERAAGGVGGRQEVRMNRLLPALSLGVALFALTVAVWPRDDAAPSVSEAPAPNKSGADAALESRIRELEDTTSKLARRVLDLERSAGAPVQGGSPAGNAASTPEGLQRELTALRSQVQDLSAGMVLESETGRQSMKEMVKAVQQEMASERRQTAIEQAVKNVEQLQTERQQRWQKFASEAQLGYSQEQALLKHIGEEDQKRKALLEQLRAGTLQQRDMRTEMRAVTGATDEAMKKSLSAEQYAKYVEMRREERSGGRRQASP
jgi:hypothetical protein